MQFCFINVAPDDLNFAAFSEDHDIMIEIGTTACGRAFIPCWPILQLLTHVCYKNAG